jgi:hypothetical protein
VVGLLVLEEPKAVPGDGLLGEGVELVQAGAE